MVNGNVFLSLLGGLVFFSCHAPDVVIIKYPDKNLPGQSPVVFAAGIISLPQTREGALSFSPDGKELFFTQSSADGDKWSIMTMQFQNEKWTAPKVWEQSDRGNNSEAYIAPNGKDIYFNSNRGAPSEKGSGRIWKSTRTEKVWSKPVEVLGHITTDKGIWFPTISDSNNLYFGAYLDSLRNLGKSDIYVKDLSSEQLPIRNFSSINSPHEEWDPYIAPDESYLLFESDRPGGFGGVDIYVSFNIDGEWQQPVNLGPSINTSAYEVAAKVSPDGKFIFFDRPKPDEQDIHWVSSSVLDSLRRQVTTGN
jgi:Tol biopolymer transport system component